MFFLKALKNLKVYAEKMCWFSLKHTTTILKVFKSLLDQQNDTSSQVFPKTYVYSPKKQSKTFKENLQQFFIQDRS